MVNVYKNKIRVFIKNTRILSYRAISMFARVLDEMIEPFMGSSSETKGIKSEQNYFSKTLPNMIYNNDPKMEIVKLTEVSNTRISSNQDAGTWHESSMCNFHNR